MNEMGILNHGRRVN